MQYINSFPKASNSSELSEHYQLSGYVAVQSKANARKLRHVSIHSVALYNKPVYSKVTTEESCFFRTCTRNYEGLYSVLRRKRSITLWSVHFRQIAAHINTLGMEQDEETQAKEFLKLDGEN
jgi:hypothetical protein